MKLLFQIGGLYFASLLWITVNSYNSYGGYRNVCIYISKYNMPTYLCVGENITYIPKPLTRKIMNLTVVSHKIKEIVTKNDFKRYPSLVVLNLTDGCIENLLMKTFHFLPFLKILDLSRNRLTEVNDKSFDFFSYYYMSLEYLSFSRNQIRDINFYNIEANHLRVLDLSHNSISKISVEDIAHLCSLQTLDLSSNPITFANACECVSFVKWISVYNITLKMDVQCDDKVLCSIDPDANKYEESYRNKCIQELRNEKQGNKKESAMSIKI